MITTGNWQDALEPIARKNFNVAFKEVPQDRDIIYNPTKSAKLTETYIELGDVGDVQELQGDLQYDDVIEGYKMTITQKEFAKGMKILRKFVQTDQLDIVQTLPKYNGLAARRRMWLDAYSIFNDAFSTAQTTIDGLALCSTAHTSNQPGITATQSNSGTSALGPVSLETARVAMKAFMTNRSNLFEVVPDMLLVPRGIEDVAWEIIQSSGKVDTANNNRNFHQGRYKLLVTDWLDDSDDWFLIDSELMKQMTVWNQVCPLEFGQADDFDGFVAKYRFYMFYGVGTRDWRWIYGNALD